MANRHSDFQKDLSKELLKSKGRRKAYFEALREEYGNDIDALRAAVRIIGNKEFSTLCGIQPPNIVNALKPGKDLRVSTVSKLLKPFGVNKANIDLTKVAS